MAKASPMIRSFNGGEASKLVEGRTDLDRYPSLSRAMLNYISAPQGPALARSGTEFVAPVFANDMKSGLIPFVFDEDDANQIYQIEFADEVIRFLSEDGLLVRAPVAATGTSTSPFEFTSAALTALGAAVGDQIVLSGFADNYNLNGEVANITAKTGDDYTIDTVYPALALDDTFQVSLVYAVESPYDEEELQHLTYLQSLDTMYLFHKKNTMPVYKLKRKDTYDWEFEQVVFIDGPYLDANDTTTTLTPSATGKHTPNMTSNSLPSGSTAFGSGNTTNHEFYRAFDAGDATSYWESNTNQTGILGYQASVAFICDGYSIVLASDNSDTSYTIRDYAPSTWTFEGSNDGTNYTVLDSKVNYVLYDNNKSLFFPVKNATAYAYYRLNIKALTRNGAIAPRVHSFVLRSTTSKVITLVASSTTGINNDQGFLTTDIGRLVRVRGVDSVWRWLKITSRTNSTTVVCELGSEPFSTLDPVTEWRLGYYSDTTGYPGCGAFYQDRLWLGGTKKYPSLLAASVQFGYENLAPTEPNGEVLDTNAIARLLNARRLAKVKWIEEVDRGLLMGAGSKEYLVSSEEGSGKSITPSTIKVSSSSARGSSSVDPVAVGTEVLFVPRSGRSVRELAYVYDADGYKSPSMSLLSSHLGVYPFAQLVYAAEPYSIVWCRRSNGTVVGLTYNREENVVGWHRHDFSGGVVESISVIPSADGLQDTLWLIVKRNVGGQEKRYIEKLTRFWDFDMTIDDAHYVDCALRYDGGPTEEVFGFQHLEGRTDIYGVADGAPVGPLTVVNGSVSLPRAASKMVLGIGFDADVETFAIEAGAQDGTAQGKEKRTNGVSFNLWQSYGGKVGTYNEDDGEVKYSPIDYPNSTSEIETISLFDGIIGPITPHPGYEKRGSVFFRRTKEIPLPFNVVAIMPQLNTQDRG